MKQLITITERDGQKLVDARELHAFLESGQKFTDWITHRIENFHFTENQDFTSFSQSNVKGGRPRTEYALTLDMAKELSMLERLQHGC